MGPELIQFWNLLYEMKQKYKFRIRYRKIIEMETRLVVDRG